MKSESEIFKGFFMLSDGRHSKMICSAKKSNLRPFIRNEVVKACQVSGSRWAEVLIVNRWDYIKDHYLLDASGKRLKFPPDFAEIKKNQKMRGVTL